MRFNTLNSTKGTPFVQTAFHVLKCGETSVTLDLPPEGDALVLTHPEGSITDVIFVSLGASGVVPIAAVGMGYEVNGNTSIILARPANATSLAAICMVKFPASATSKTRDLLVQAGTFNASKSAAPVKPQGNAA